MISRYQARRPDVDGETWQTQRRRNTHREQKRQAR